MGRCDDTAGKGVRALRKIKKRLALLAAGLALAVMTTGCSSGAAQPKQIGTRNMASTASLISSMAGEEEVNVADTQLGAGTAAAATYLIKERCSPSLTNQEDTGELSDRMREESNTQKYNRYSAPTSPGLTRMARLFLYPGDWPEDEVARAARLGHAVGVEPHVYLHEAAVRLVDDELQGVVVRFGTLALFAREPVGPRFVGRQVERIGRGTYLQYHRVDVVACQAVE